MRILLTFFIILVHSQFAFSQNTMFDVCPLKIGAELPEVTLTDENNKQQTLAALTAEKPTILVFYRGAWCGYCTQHLAELNDAKNEIETLGYNIIGITIDQANKITESYEKAAEEIKVYSDSKAEAIEAFGLNWQVDDTTFEKYVNSYDLNLEEWSGEKHHELPVPAVYIIKEGKVLFKYVNPTYSTRLKTETLLAILKTM